MDVRERWKNEALDFTPWLARNLDLLGQAVDLKLEVVRPEEQVGPFSLDILAKETGTNVHVAIENQLEWTDHTHGHIENLAAAMR